MLQSLRRVAQLQNQGQWERDCFCFSIKSSCQVQPEDFVHITDNIGLISAGKGRIQIQPWQHYPHLERARPGRARPLSPSPHCRPPQKTSLLLFYYSKTMGYPIFVRVCLSSIFTYLLCYSVYNDVYNNCIQFLIFVILSSFYLLSCAILIFFF